MVQERTNGFLSERNSDNVKVKKHVSEPEQAVPISEAVAYGLFCSGIVSEYIDLRNVLTGQSI
jgi:hypothetical protein